MSTFSLLNRVDITELEKQVFDLDGKLKVMPYSFYKEIDENSIKFLMWKHGVYVIPTQELIDWLKANIKGFAIEIGAGIGTIGRSLHIPITDSRMQDLPHVKFQYNMSGQPTIKYPDDIEKLDASEAILKYKPKTVIGCFITHKFNSITNNGNALGVNEELLLQKVDRYINVGNLFTHKDKPILKKLPTEYYFEWLITRSNDQSLNRIWIYDKK